MKKIYKYVFIALLVYGGEAFAFIPPPGPISPVFDAINDVIETGKGIMKKLRTVADEAQQIRDKALNAIKSAKNFIGLDLKESVLQKEAGAPAIASAKDIKESKIADIKDASAVAGAYQSMFLEYPLDLFEKFPIGQREAIKNMYDKKRVEFANDGMFELYLSIRDLEENRLPALAEEIKTLSECYVEGKQGMSALCDSASAADEELGNAANDYKLRAAYDSYMRTYQELIALKAQYETGLALQTGVKPFNAEELEKSAPDLNNMSYRYEEVRGSAFAQLGKTSLLRQNDVALKPVVAEEKAVQPALKTDLAQQNDVALKPAVTEEKAVQPALKTDLAPQNDLALKPVAAGEKAVQPMAKSSLLQQDDAASKPAVVEKKTIAKPTNPALQLEKSVPFKKHTPFEGAEDQLKLLPILEGVYDMLSEAQQMHNTKQQLPDLRKPFLEYEKMRALHAEAITRLAESEEKARNYFSNYYNTTLANDLWFGKGCSLKKIKLGKKCPTVTGCKSAKDYADHFVYYILCPKDVYSVTKYAKKDGLSGYAISAYRVSKADKILNMDGEVIGYVNDAGSALDLSGKKIGVVGSDKKMAVDEDGKSLGTIVSATLAVDPDNLGTAVVDLDMNTSTPEFGSEPDLNKMVGGDELSSPSDEDEAEASVREQNLNRWQIGSEISKLVGRDMQGEMLYGTPQKKYPVWGDEKRFYDQYIDEKFTNYTIYLLSPRINLGIFALANVINDAMEVDQEALEAFNKATDAQYAGTISYWQRQASKAETSSERNQAYNAMRRVERERDQKKADHKKEVEEKLEKEKLINTQTISKAQNTWRKTVEAYENSSELKDMLSTHHQVMKNLYEKYKGDLKKYNDDKYKLYKQIDTKLEALNEKKQQYNDLIGLKKDAAEGMDAEDENIRLLDEKKKQDPSYTSGLKDKAIQRKQEDKETMEKADKQAKGVLDGVDGLSADVERLRKDIKNLDKKIEKLKKDYIKNAVKTEYKQLEEMRKALLGRGGKIPLMPPSLLLGSTATIVPIYAMSTVLVETFKGVAGVAVADAYIAMGQQRTTGAVYDPDKYEIIAKIHKNMLDHMLDDQYLPAELKVSDLIVSNKSVISSAGATIFSIMFGDKKQYEKEDEVYMLSMNPSPRDFYAPKRISPERTAPVREVFHFDSGDYDMVLKTDAVLLKKPQTTRDEFLRSGLYIPAIWKTILGPNGFVERDVDVLSIIGSSEGKGVKEFLKAKGEKAAPVNSELSLLFKYDEGLTFTNPMYDLAKYFEDAANTDKKIDENEMKDNEKKMLSRDQVGDYLQFMDLEQTYQTLEDQLKIKVDEGRQNIEAVLEKVSCPYKKKVTGYIKEGEMQTKIVSTEYIADQETYEAIAKCLDQGKNMFIKEAKGLMAQLPSELSEYVLEHKAKTDNMLKALEMDNEELVQLSDNTPADESLDQEIKSKTTDNAVVGKYGNEAQAEFEKNLDQFEKPYFAVYF